MRRKLTILAFGLFLAGAATGLAPSRGLAIDYLSAANDLPLAEGLVEAKEKATIFDSPIGRIVTAYAHGNLAIAAVRDFYAASLPQLGWEETENGNWRRQGQSLKIDILGPEKGPVDVTFTLSSEN